MIGYILFKSSPDNHCLQIPTPEDCKLGYCITHPKCKAPPSFCDLHPVKISLLIVKYILVLLNVKVFLLFLGVMKLLNGYLAKQYLEYMVIDEISFCTF